MVNISEKLWCVGVCAHSFAKNPFYRVDASEKRRKIFSDNRDLL